VLDWALLHSGVALITVVLSIQQVHCILQPWRHCPHAPCARWI